MAEGRTEREAEQERQATVPAPLVPARPSPFVLFVKTVNTLWGSDRILRTGQFLGRFIAGSPELGSEANALGLTFSAAFSQARYINRIYGIPDGIEGLVYDIPAGPSHVRALKIVLHSVGAVGYHMLENFALILMIIRRCDPGKIPRVKAWLERMGLWSRADDIDALAQWCWFVEAAIKLYFALITRKKILAALKKAMATNNTAVVPQLLNHRTMVQCDIIKNVTDCLLAPHYAVMFGDRPGFLRMRHVGVFGMAGSIAQFVVRYRQQYDKEYSYDMGLRM